MNQAFNAMPGESDSLKSELASTHQALLEKDLLIAQLRQRVELLEALTSLLKHRQFGASSEKGDGQLGLFNEAETDADETVDEAPVETSSEASSTPPRARRGKRRPLPADIPRTRVEHDLSDAEKLCACGTERTRIGEVSSEQLDIIPAQVRVLQHVRFKYACPCCEGEVVEAPLPPQPIPKSQASARLLAHICVAKYQDGLPLHRQQPILERAGLDLPRNTLARWMIRLGELSAPLIDRLDQTLRQSAYLHMDETPIQVHNEAGKPAQSASTLWVRRSASHDPPVIVFHYAPSRSGEVAAQLLERFQGYLHSDDYAAYGQFDRAEAITALGCWAHVRRKFVDAARVGAGSAKSRAQTVVQLIAKLYAVEKRHRDSDAATRAQARQDEAGPVLTQIDRWLEKMAPKVLPKSPLGKAIAYARKNWPKLTVYTTEGWLNIDNNPAENAIRPFVIGRKNWLFADTPAGAEASARLYSLIETAKANGLEPFSYLAELFTKLPAATTDADIDALLPWNIKPPPMPEPDESG